MILTNVKIIIIIIEILSSKCSEPVESSSARLFSVNCLSYRKLEIHFNAKLPAKDGPVS